MCSKLLFAALALACLATAEPEGVGCKTTDKVEGPCKIHYKVCAHISGIHLRYEGTATDTKSGISASGPKTKSGTGAAEAATVLLYNKLVVKPSNTTTNATDPCNCFTSVKKVNNNCVLQGTVCFYFINQHDLDAGKPAYKAWTYDEQAGFTGYNDNAAGYNATQAVIDSVKDLAAHESLAKCLAPGELDQKTDGNLVFETPFEPVSFPLSALFV